MKHLKVFESFDRPRGDGDSEDVIEALSVFEELFDEFSITRHEALAWMPTSHKYPKNSITCKIFGPSSFQQPFNFSFVIFKSPSKTTRCQVS